MIETVLVDVCDPDSSSYNTADSIQQLVTRPVCYLTVMIPTVLDPRSAPAPSSILKRILHNPRQMLPPILARDVPNARREVQHAALRERPLHQPRDILRSVPDRSKPPRHVEAVEEARDGLEEVRADVGVGD